MQGLVNPAEVMVHKLKGYGVGEVFKLISE